MHRIQNVSVSLPKSMAEKMGPNKLFLLYHSQSQSFLLGCFSYVLFTVYIGMWMGVDLRVIRSHAASTVSTVNAINLYTYTLRQYTIVACFYQLQSLSLQSISDCDLQCVFVFFFHTYPIHTHTHSVREFKIYVIFCSALFVKKRSTLFHKHFTSIQNILQYVTYAG